jgi:sulfite exporter TauE/SafE
MTLLTAGPLQLSPSAVATNADLLVFLVIGLLAGAHCLGMCGPLVGLYADRMASTRNEQVQHSLTLFEVRQHALFNSGRVLGYATMGALFGLLGGTLFAGMDTISAAGDGIRAVSGLLIGTLVIAGGVGYVLRGSTAHRPISIPYLSTAFRRVNGFLTSRVDRLAGSSGIIALGTVHSVLPCPIIYPAYLYALAIGNPVRGALSLGLLGIGTFPTLFAYGTAIGTLSTRQRVGLHRVLGVAFVALGYILLSHGLVLLGFDVPHVPIPYHQPLTGT